MNIGSNYQIYILPNIIVSDKGVLVIWMRIIWIEHRKKKERHVIWEN